jgi:hypothetical protein
MKWIALSAAVLLVLQALPLSAYDIKGAKPVSKLEEQQAKAKADKKLITLVYKGSDNTCPHCAAAAENGIKAVQSSSVMVLITEKEAKESSIVSTLPKAIQDVLSVQHRGAYVSFTVFDADLTKVIASGDRYALEKDQKKIHEFTSLVREAKKEIK